ncbi:MAG: hypothetical protein RL398_2760 [Planctomycetota bacterium]|jgi:hypothetical protein
MQLLPLLGGGAAIAAAALFLDLAPAVATGTKPASAAPAPVLAPAADAGHDVLVVQGDRDHLAITNVVRKADPWAGNPKAMASDWRLEIRAADGALLDTVLLDVTPFATRVEDKGRARRVEGCVVIDSRIAMLVNAPRHPDAAGYEFFRGTESIGRCDATEVVRLAEGGR